MPTATRIRIIAIIISLFLKFSFFISKSIYDYCFENYEVDDYDEPISIRNVLYYDFDMDGLEEVIIEGFSCYGGTGGMDIHDVWSFKNVSNPVPLKPYDHNIEFNGKQIYDGLVGNSNFQYSVIDGQLVETWTDRSGRKNPLTIYWTWNGEEFVVDKVLKEE